jgi:hypothetical protein
VKVNQVRVNHRQARKGIALTLLAFLLMILMAFVAIGVDVGLFYMQQAELQVTASSAAAGAALDLPEGAVATAQRLASANMPPEREGTVLGASGVQIGNWNSTTRVFTADGAPLNAVRVTTEKSNANGNSVRWLIGQVLRQSAIELRATATAALLPELPGAIGGTGSITITGNSLVDSYNSTQGAYDPATAGQEGDIVSDGTISIGGSSLIRGDVRGQTVSTGGAATVSGSISPQRRSVDFPSVDISEIVGTNDNESLPLYRRGNQLVSPLDANRNFSLTGGVEYLIPPGDYYFNDLTLSGQSSLLVTGPTTIYLTGDLDTSGGNVINSSLDPNQLRILMTGGTAVVNASVDWYGLLYAPDSEVIVKGSGEVFGAIVGETVELSGTGDVHFDEGLVVSDLIDGISRRSAIVN